VSTKTESERDDEVRSEDVNQRRSSEMESPTEVQDDYEIALAQKSQVSEKLICTDCQSCVLLIAIIYGPISSSRHRVQTVCGTHQASYQMDIGESFPGCEADQSPPSSAEVKDTWLYLNSTIRHGLAFN
jgi:hypothetical protein